LGELYSDTAKSV